MKWSYLKFHKEIISTNYSFEKACESNYKKKLYRPTERAQQTHHTTIYNDKNATNLISEQKTI